MMKTPHENPERDEPEEAHLGTTRPPIFWMAWVYGLIFVVFIVSVLINGFSALQLAVLLAPLAFYTLCVCFFGVDSVIEMGVVTIIVTPLIVIGVHMHLLTLAALHKRSHRPVHQIIKNAPKPAPKRAR